MKRSDFIEKIRASMGGLDAEEVLSKIESLGMKPPCLPENHCQAIMDVYYAGYTFNKWEEDFEKDDKLVKALERRLKRPLRQNKEN